MSIDSLSLKIFAGKCLQNIGLQANLRIEIGVFCVFCVFYCVFITRFCASYFLEWLREMQKILDILTFFIVRFNAFKRVAWCAIFSAFCKILRL